MNKSLRIFADSGLVPLWNVTHRSPNIVEIKYLHGVHIRRFTMQHHSDSLHRVQSISIRLSLMARVPHSINTQTLTDKA